jgi:uncharacterized protein (DUF4415 family)
MHQINTAYAFKQAANTDEKLAIDPAILAWFRARGRGWQDEINGVLEFYIDTIEHPASEPAPPIPGGPDLEP